MSMAFFTAVIDLFKNLFSSSSPDSHFKGELKQYETELKNLQPQLYKNGFLTPNIAELFHILYKETKPLFELFSLTIAGEDSLRSNKYTDMLITTGFFAETKDDWIRLNYDHRKRELEESGESAKIYEIQHKRLEKILHTLDGKDFKKIEQVIQELNRLVDICRFNFISVLHQFDPLFTSEKPSYVPQFQSVLLSDVENTLMDIYFLTASLSIKMPEARAIIALAELQKGRSISEEETQKYLKSIKKINAIFRNILTKQNLQRMIFLSKNTTEFQLQTASYSKKLIQPFKERFKKQYDADTKRIQSEFQDLKITKDLYNLFGAKELNPLRGYNHENNKFLQENSMEAFHYVTPMQILNTFIKTYVTDQILTMLNGIVVEGFFNNPLYKTDFAAAVFACSESRNRIAEFEKSFDKNEENDIILIKSYTTDGQQNVDLLKKMSQMIENANLQAKALLQDITNNFNDLQIKINSLLSESKKSVSIDISNIKMLLTSTRNKDSTELLEKQFPSWRIFLDIMQNYVIISDIEKKNT